MAGALAIDYRAAPGDGGGAGRRPVEVTATEYELLHVLSLDAGRVVDFETLLRRFWAKRDDTDANLVRIFVRNLRRRLRRQRGQPRLYLHQRGVGYRMAAPGGPPRRPSAR